jgi:hypothetical protein
MSEEVKIVDIVPHIIKELHSIERKLKEEMAARIYYESVAGYRYSWNEYPENLGNSPSKRYFRDLAEKELRESGNLSPYIMEKKWDISEDRKLALDRAVRFMSWAVNTSSYSRNEDISKDLKILKSMIDESEGEDGIQN